MPPCLAPEQLPPWACGFAQSWLDIGAILPTRDGRAIGNATILSIEPHDELCFVVRLVTDAGTEVRMTEREVHDAFHRPKWIRQINPEDDIGSLIKRLRMAGSQGADLSPGDPLALEAANALTKLVNGRR